MGRGERQLGRARRNMRQFLRRVEREWWRERIEECENACNSGRMGEMYKILIEIRDWEEGMEGATECGHNSGRIQRAF